MSKMISVRVSDDLAEWLDAQEGSKTDVVSRALESVRVPVVEPQVVPAGPERVKLARPGLRHVAMCDHSECVPPHRAFLGSEEEADAWVCPEHGRARRQLNKPYLGQSTAA